MKIVSLILAMLMVLTGVPTGVFAVTTPDLEHVARVEGEQPVKAKVISIAEAIAAREGVDPEVSAAASLGVDVDKVIDEATKVFDLQPFDVFYLKGLWLQLLNPQNAPKQLKIKVTEDDDGNFILVSRLNPGEVESKWGGVSYDELEGVEKYEEAAKGTVIIVNSMDGGIGESLERTEWLKKKTGAAEVTMGAKGTDLGYHVSINGQDVFVSIAEAKLIQLADIAKSKHYAGVKFQPLVNHQSKASYDNLLAKSYVLDVLNGVKNPRTYKDILEDAGVEILPFLMQSDLPAVNDETDIISTNPRANKQPGGHGQWGVLFLYTMYQQPVPDEQIVRVFYNGDNINSAASKYIAGYMVENNIPLLKLTTKAEPIDVKGGKEGLRIVTLENGETLLVPDQMEVADAKSAKQLDLFVEAGQKSDTAKKGPQPFNTNVIYFNETLLTEILRDLAAVVRDEVVKTSPTLPANEIEAEVAERMAAIFSPTLIRKPTKDPVDPELKAAGIKFVPLDGAIGVVIHKLNTFFMTSENPDVKNILEKRGIDQLLMFVDVPRTEFFTPVKKASDMWFQAYTDYYNFNTETMRLEDAVEGNTPPALELSGDKYLDEKGKEKEDPYWKELQNVVDSLGENGKVQQLDRLEIKGRVKLPDAELIGNVKITNNTGKMVNMESEDYREPLQDLFTGDYLKLENVEITFHENERVEVKQASASSLGAAEVLDAEPVSPVAEVRALPFGEKSELNGKSLSVIKDLETLSQRPTRAFANMADFKYFDEVYTRDLASLVLSGKLDLTIYNGSIIDLPEVFQGKVRVTPQATYAEAVESTLGRLEEGEKVLHISQKEGFAPDRSKRESAKDVIFVRQTEPGLVAAALLFAQYPDKYKASVGFVNGFFHVYDAFVLGIVQDYMEEQLVSTMA